MSYYNDPYDGPSPMDELASDYEHLREYCDKLETLILTLIENEPADTAADGVTVLEVWRKEARELFGLDRPKPQPVTLTPPVWGECDDDLPF